MFRFVTRNQVRHKYGILIARGGLARPSVSLGAFDGIAGVEDSGAEEPSRRVFGVLDLECGFVPDREVTVSGTALSTGMGATRVRPGLGCALDPDAAGTMRLSSQGHCITAGASP